MVVNISCKISCLQKQWQNKIPWQIISIGHSFPEHAWTEVIDNTILSWGFVFPQNLQFLILKQYYISPTKLVYLLVDSVFPLIDSVFPLIFSHKICNSRLVFVLPNIQRFTTTFADGTKKVKNYKGNADKRQTAFLEREKH